MKGKLLVISNGILKQLFETDKAGLEAKGYLVTIMEATPKLFPFSSLAEESDAQVWIDLTCKQTNGLEAMALLKKNHKKTTVRAFGATDNKILLASLINIGFSGYLHVDCPSPGESVLKAFLDAIANTDKSFLLWLPPGGKTTVSEISEQLAMDSTKILTLKEFEVLYFYVPNAGKEGLMQRFSIEKGTLGKHLTMLYKKLGLKDIASLYQFAVESRLS